MWFIWDGCGIACVIFVYLILIMVDAAVIRVGLWEELSTNPAAAGINITIFQLILLLILWSHFKCMVTDPGALPKNYDTLELNLLPSEVHDALEAAGRKNNESILNLSDSRVVDDHSMSRESERKEGEEVDRRTGRRRKGAGTRGTKASGKLGGSFIAA